MSNLKFLVPCNWDIDLLKQVKNFPIHYIYGKLDADFIGGGRATASLPPITKAEAENFIKTIIREKINFNYLINASCLDNQEFFPEFHHKLDNLLEWLADLGVDYLTVANPYLLTIIKQCYPQFKVVIGQMALVNTLPKAKYYQDLGADEITLHFEVNRNFELLENVTTALNIPTTLIANVDCLRFCPLLPYHSQLLAHASQENHPSKGFFLNYCSVNCNRIKSNPKEYIKLVWIRPEDLHYYEDIGINQFKIVSRARSTNFLIRAIKAYKEKKYRGNLLDILDCIVNKGCLKTIDRQNPYAPPGIDLSGEKFLLNVHGNYPIKYIDNLKLEGFLEYFVRQKPNCGNMDCNQCKYCDSWAENAILKVDTHSNYEEAIKLLNSRKIFTSYS